MSALLPTLAEPQQFSLGEKFLFAALAAASLYGFWRRFGPILAKILQSKKDPDFHLFPIGWRVRDFVWEVLCQAKVIRERPLAGMAHALVFWAFCAFALVTLNHCAAIFGLAFLDPAGRVGRLYFYFAAAFAVACAAGIAGLFVRRFLVRPRWLGELSWGSGLVALLIFLLMATYLAAFFVGGASGAARTLWWAHTLTLLAFLPVIPHTKHLHLVLSPFTVFLSRGGFAHIPPLVGDEDFGLVSGKDLTRLVSLQAYSCVECGRCMEHCPANNTGKLLNPKEIVLGLRGYLNEYGPASEEPLLGKYNAQEAAFQCTTCGACEFQCPVGIEHVPILVGLRRGAVNTGAWKDDHGAKLFLALERGSNALGMSTAERDKFIEKNALPFFDGTQEYCLWLGCMGAYDPRGREIVLSLVKVMRYLGTSFGVLRKERCTGDPVRRLGNDLLFEQLAEREPGSSGAEQGEEDRLDLPALRPHHPGRLEGVRNTARGRASQRVSGSLRSPTTARPKPGKDRLSRSLLPRPLSRSLRGAAPDCRAGRRFGGGPAFARAQLLLRRGRRTGVPGRGEGRARERGARGGTGGDWRKNRRRGLPLLQYDVPGCVRGEGRGRAGVDGHCRDRRAQAAGVKLIA